MTTPYELIGGDEGISRLVDAFYRHMSEAPHARGIRALHAEDLTRTRAVLKLYFREWMGGPKDYSAQRGHPRLRMRHMPFAIGEAERDAWLQCMEAALVDVGASDDLRRHLMGAFAPLADWMRNTDTGAANAPGSTGAGGV